MHRPLSRSLRPKFFMMLRRALVAGFVFVALVSPLNSALATRSNSTSAASVSAVETSSPAPAPAAAADAATTDAQKTTQENETVGQSSSWTDTVASAFASVASVIASFLGKLIILVLDITIPIMQYQGFVGSPVVIAGWAIVRDVVNMFFVVVLIVIAMGTIFGSSKFTWRQQVPKLMLFAILINFSKTLCGLMIDFAQVIMLTFANALKDIAGGNFIQLLGLGPMMQLSESADPTKNGISPFDLFTASAAAVIMMTWVLAIVIMLLFILVYRVVMLWILIVMAPLAWFTAAVPFDQAKGSYAEWWKNFVCYCTVGPVITFFLWLTLAVAGSGNIAANDTGFSSASPDELSQNTAGGLTAIFEWQHLTSFIIGMAMLVAGMDAAAKVCQGVKGPGFNKLLSATKGGGFINQFAGAQARKYGEKGGKWAGRKSVDLAGGIGAGALAMAGGKKFKEAFSMTESGTAARAEGQRMLANKLGDGLVGGYVGDKLHASADERQKSLAERRKKGVEEEYKDASPERTVARLKKLTGRDATLMNLSPADLGLLADAITNSKTREKLEAEKLPDGSSVLEVLVQKHLPDLKKQLKGSKDFEKIEEFEKSRPDIVSDSKREVVDPVTGGVVVEINKPINKIDADNVKDLDPSAYRSEEVRAQLETIMTDIVKETNTVGGVTTYTYYNELEAAQEGKRGQKKYKASMQNEDGSLEPPTAGIAATATSPAIPPKAHGKPRTAKKRKPAAVVRLDPAGVPIP